MTSSQAQAAILSATENINLVLPPLGRILFEDAAQRNQFTFSFDEQQGISVTDLAIIDVGDGNRINVTDELSLGYIDSGEVSSHF